MSSLNSTVTISYLDARAWYKSDNKTLKDLALKAFSKEALELEVVEDIIQGVETSERVTLVPTKWINKENARQLLLFIIDKCNGDWRPFKANGTGGYGEAVSNFCDKPPCYLVICGSKGPEFLRCESRDSYSHSEVSEHFIPGAYYLKDKEACNKFEKLIAASGLNLKDLNFLDERTVGGPSNPISGERYF